MTAQGFHGKLPNMRAIILETRPEVVGELKEVFVEFKIQVVQWSPKGSGWMVDFQKNRPDVVFIDYLLPGRDGLSCLEKAIELTNQPYYFFMHSYRGTKASLLEGKAFILGADAVVQKPLSRSRLRASLQRMIRSREGSNRRTRLVIRE